jgi:hypothetical protein
MYDSFEEKGKIHTNVISKIPVDAIIQTTNHRIEGKIHVRPDDRLKDELSNSDNFLAVTNAVVYDKDGEVQYKTNFISVHRDQIIWIIPIDDLITPGSEA